MFLLRISYASSFLVSAFPSITHLSSSLLPICSSFFFVCAFFSSSLRRHLPHVPSTRALGLVNSNFPPPLRKPEKATLGLIRGRGLPGSGRGKEEEEEERVGRRRCGGEKEVGEMGRDGRSGNRRAEDGRREVGGGGERWKKWKEKGEGEGGDSREDEVERGMVGRGDGERRSKWNGRGKKRNQRENRRKRRRRRRKGRQRKRGKEYREELTGAVDRKRRWVGS